MPVREPTDQRGKCPSSEHVLASAARKLKLGLYTGARKALSANMKLGLPGTVAHRNLSFMHFEDQRKKYFEDAC